LIRKSKTRQCAACPAIVTWSAITYLARRDPNVGVKFDHSRPYHPQTCGKVERFHQTQKKWLAAQPAAATLPGLQRQLDRFATYYNTVRPHRALQRRTPTEAYAARPKAIPTGVKIPAHYRVRNDTVDSGGTSPIGSRFYLWALRP
jgi:hypothetical protein